MKKSKLDKSNLKILSVLQKNSTLTAEEIAEAVELSPSAVQKRVRQLRHDGVIERETAIISTEALGGVTLFIVNIQLIRTRHHTIDTFRELVKNSGEVLQCFHITGSFDLCLLVVAKNTDAYEAFAERMFTEENSVARFETSLVLRTIKMDRALPLDQLV